MNFSLKQALKVFLIFACAIGVTSASIIITNKNNDNAKSKNDSLWNVVDGSDSDNGSDDDSTPTNGPNGEPLVSKTESQVGKYADIDGDGTVDGIIFADLLIGGSGKWDNDYKSTYTIPTISSSKDYYVSQESYTNALGGTAEVLTPTGSGAERFYIMSLNDVDSNYHKWYNAAYSSGISDWSSITSQDFGTGKSNTTTMVNKWNSKSYGEQNTGSYTDLWNEIQTQAGNGWFIPSREEWAAFGNGLNLTKDNYSSKGLKIYYWSSSLRYASSAYYSSFLDGHIGFGSISGNDSVRLATTF